MAQRLATEYVKASLTLTETEMKQFANMLTEHGVQYHVMVLDNGNQQLMFQDTTGEEMTIVFERRGEGWVSEGSYRINTLPLTNVMRKAVSEFKGNAIVNRIYANFTMAYYYEQGIIVKIIEMNENGQRLIYEYRNTAGRLQQLYQKTTVESEIVSVKEQVNQLLDARNNTVSYENRSDVDRELRDLTRKLFILEA